MVKCLIDNTFITQQNENAITVNFLWKYFADNPTEHHLQIDIKVKCFCLHVFAN